MAYQLMNKTARIVGILMLASLAGCVNDSTSNGPSAQAAQAAVAEQFDYNLMLANLADNVIIPNYQRLNDEAQRFAAPGSALANYCRAIGTANEATARADAQQAWQVLAAVTQVTEMHAVGPVLTADNNSRVLRYRLNNFTAPDTFSSCGVDQSVVLNQTPGFDVSPRLVNQRSIRAVEYLLFNDNLNQTCPSQIVETQSWDSLPEQQRRQQRCDYAQVLANDIVAASTTVLNAWQTEGDDFRSQFINPANRETNLNDLSDALFAIEVEVKDDKLGVPLGINRDCGSLVCPEQIESQYADATISHVVNNLEGFLQVFTGEDGLSFDDIINQAGFPEVTQNLISLSSNAALFAQNIDRSLTSQIQQIQTDNDDTACINSAANPDDIQTLPACSLQGFLKRLTDVMRTDFVTIVELDLPDSAQSDND